jgi:5-methyltetrahydrofolate--homocysteine methyltransferase
VVGESARNLYNDAKAMLAQIVDEKWITANSVVGFFPANSHEDDIHVYADDNREKVIETFSMLRQQGRKPKDKFNLSLADFVAPKNSGIQDYVGFFAVTTGVGAESRLLKFEQENDEYNSILFKALMDRLAEAFAEYMHEKVRKNLWGYKPEENLSTLDLVEEKYHGIRPAPGYPACPDHTEKTKLFSLLNVTAHSSIKLTENYAMYPASSVSGFYFSHPESHYFAVGKLNEDQVMDYARRKQMELDEIKRWLSPHLG